MITMFCKKCGKKISDGAKFCKYCGTQLSKAEKKDLSQKENKTCTKKKSIPKFIKKTILYTVVLSGFLLVLIFFKIVRVPFLETMMENKKEEEQEVDIEKSKIEHPNADEYYEKNAQVISRIDVNKSTSVETEAQVIENIESRGFTDYPITYEYLKNGDYNGENYASLESNETHPIYQTYYISSRDELWTIFEINGAIMANPVSYNLQAERTVQLLVSESETVMSYDSETCMFYETIPSEEELNVKIVDRIDSTTLDKLTIEVLSSL